MPVTVSWSGWSPTVGTSGSNVYSTAGTLVDGSSHIEKKISQWMRRPQFRSLRALLRTLDGNAVGGGGNVTNNKTRVQAQAILGTYAQGGLVTIETVPALGATTAGRVTATADQTQLNGMIDEIVYPSSYPADASGNGGGGKLGY